MVKANRRFYAKKSLINEKKDETQLRGHSLPVSLLGGIGACIGDGTSKYNSHGLGIICELEE